MTFLDPQLLQKVGTMGSLESDMIYVKDIIYKMNYHMIPKGVVLCCTPVALPSNQMSKRNMTLEIEKLNETLQVVMSTKLIMICHW